MKEFQAKITVDGVTYELPQVSTAAYLEYLDVREPIAAKEMYTRSDFYAMADCLCKLYGDKFTRDDLLGENGVAPGEVIVQFSAVESVLMKQVNHSIEDLKKNFTNGA